MGFARDRVEGALRRADNDTALALNILLDPEAAAETAAAAEPEPAAQASSAAVAKTAAVAADARGWARVADRSAPLAQLLAEEFGEEGGAALLDQAAAAAAANPPPAPPLTLTIDQGFSGSQQDHEKHPWTSVNLPAGYASGTLKVSWKDQGFGNRKGRLWCRRLGAPYQGQSPPTGTAWHWLSPTVAEHSWTQAEFELPVACFERPYHTPAAEWNRPFTLELACEVGGGGGHSLHVRAGATLTLRRRRRRRRRRDRRAGGAAAEPAAAARGAGRAQRGHPRERSCGARWAFGRRLSRGARHARAVGGGEGGRVDRGHQPRPADPRSLRGVVDVVADVDPSRTRRGEGARPREQQRIGVEHRQGRRPTGDRLARRAHGDHLPQHGRRSTRNAAVWTGGRGSRRAASRAQRTRSAARPAVNQRAHSSFVATGSNGYRGISLRERARWCRGTYALRSDVQSARICLALWGECSCSSAISATSHGPSDGKSGGHRATPGYLAPMFRGSWRTATRTVEGIGRGALG